MGIRTVCLALAIFVASGVLRWIFVGLAVVLPYVAVILANAGPSPTDEQPKFVTLAHPELTTGGNPTPASGTETERIP